MLVTDLLGEEKNIVLKSELLAIDKKIDDNLNQFFIDKNINPNPETWGLSYIIKSVDVLLEKEYEAMCTDILDLIEIQNKHGSFFGKDVDIEIKFYFVEFIAWVKNQVPDYLKPSLSFKAIMAFKGFNPGDAADGIMNKFGEDANIALRMYRQSFDRKSNELFGMEID